MKSLLMEMPPDTIYGILTRGLMRIQSSQLSDEQRRQVVEYLTGRRPGESAQLPLLKCGKKIAPLGGSVATGTGWGIDAANTRSLTAQQAGLTAKDLHELKLKWVFGFPESSDVHSQPLVVGNNLFVGSQTGTVYALDARSGCVHWAYQANGEVRGGLVYRPDLGSAKRGGPSHPVLVFGDIFAYVYTLDAATGSLIWKVKIDDHPAARIVAAPVLSRDDVYMSLGSMGEEDAAVSGDYACCTFRGSLVALNRVTGQALWKRYTIPEPAVQQSVKSGKPQFGPSGAGIWSTPAYDERRGTVYLTTGNNYSDPPDDNSDAIFAVDAATGRVKWKVQATAHDAYNDGCNGQNAPTCPSQPGIDADFTAPPILVRNNHGRDILIAGQKSGDAFGMDPDSGAILWHTRVSRDPSPLSGGIWFGMSVQDGRVIVPSISLQPMTQAWAKTDDEFFPPAPINGVYALDVSTGKLLWSATEDSYCDQKTRCLGVMMAPLSIPGAALVASRRGLVLAFDDQAGQLLWHFDTNQQFTAVNGEKVAGGQISGAGTLMVANGMLYVHSNSGTSSMLLAFARQDSRGVLATAAPRTRSKQRSP